ncbi:MAG: aminotransferase class I/II-fold pyridoxal phosphate-dependent enzyme [Eggerthella lenta]
MPDPAAAERHGIVFDAAVLANPGYPAAACCRRSRRCLPTSTPAPGWWLTSDPSSSRWAASMVSLVNEHRNLVVVRSLCEPFAMPGIPISYCIAHPDTIAQITRFYDSSCVPMFAEVIGELALTETEHLERTREFLDSEIPWLQCMLNLIPGIDIFPAEANYVMCTFDGGPDLALGVANTDELASACNWPGSRAQAGRNSALEDSRYFCVAVRTREDNEKLVAALREIVVGC